MSIAAGILKDIAVRTAILPNAREQRNSFGRHCNQLQYHAENSPLAIIEFNKEYQLTRWSRQAEKIFGWSAPEVLEKRIDQLRWIHEDDVQSVADLSADMLAARRNTNVHANRNYRKDGSVIYCEWYNSALLDSAGKLVSVQSWCLTSTRRKQMEHELYNASGTCWKRHLPA